MTTQEFAKMLTGREYYFPLFTKEEIEMAKENGFVIVHGDSDDCVVFDGAITAEICWYEGEKVDFDKDGVSDDDKQLTKPNVIEPMFCDENAVDINGDMITWSFKTDIPHETFMIYEYDEPFCRGMVISLDDLK